MNDENATPPIAYKNLNAVCLIEIGAQKAGGAVKNIISKTDIIDDRKARG